VTASSPVGPPRSRGPRLRGGLVGAGAAACAVCCAAPLLTLLGIGVTGAAATALTMAFAGVVFGLVVAVATIAAIVVRRRQARRSGCGDGAPGEVTGPVAVQLLSTPPDRD
jgi:uncharacterized protein (DUF58 family)